MQLNHLILAAFLGLAAAKRDNTRTNKLCRTAQGTKSVDPVPTVTYTKEKTYTIRRTTRTQKIVTRTLEPITSTTTETTIATVETTADPETDTVEVLATEYETSTITVDTTTFTETATVSTDVTISSTSTVPAPGSFRPIQDTLPGGTQNGNSGTPFKRSDATSEFAFSEEHEVLEIRQPGSGSLLAAAGGVFEKRSGLCSPQGQTKYYPQNVKCDVTISVPKTVVITKTKPATTTTLPASVSTITQTETITSTSTAYLADVTVSTTSTTTSIIEETSTPSTTSTTSTTLTYTVNVPGPTINALCASNNYADSTANVGHFPNAFPGTQYGLQQAQVSSAYECCEACASTPLCSSSGYQPGYCVLITVPATSVCLTTPCTGKVQYSASSGAFTFMNGPYLQWNAYQ
ncbi:hypothetical protein G7Z17_g1381 [Cylindrodendrum hubeiense]|uniref:Apple domain-containing protein n=1 Tax=Cylindrodendrum hubeiense TaxID=595255 RepID=A0A9P5HLR4_9HYPO|nr:hypothetical protein G7Z17_g1381 [Cylindrodendrum hubeiense]